MEFPDGLRKYNILHQKQVMLIRECIKKYNLPYDLIINEQLLECNKLPKTPSKHLAVLLLCYFREATKIELKKISDQPPAIIRDLRNSGFKFKQDNSNKYFYKNEHGLICRKIIGFQATKNKSYQLVKDILQKSVSAAISAIEIYNKPDFKYREENFTILMVNAWELLLKGKIIFENNGKLKSIYVKKNNRLVKNRSGNPMTISVIDAAKILNNQNKLPEKCLINLTALIEIRDNSIHFINKDLLLSKKVQEFGTANLKNFLSLVNQWFDVDLKKYNFYLMPISFYHIPELESNSISKQTDQIKLLREYLNKVLLDNQSDDIEDYNIALKIETKFVKASESQTVNFKYSNDPNATQIKVSEESVFETQYPLQYNDIIDLMEKKFTDFKRNQKFYKLKKEFEDKTKHGEKYCKERYLNVHKTGTKRNYYSPEIIKELGRHYTKK
ncbi:DUF3644 domain-containing protein [uncultured Aquimarina sp.]|uniref:DUF3644 domain-containing protein n=1 Tax=uncultured Aquimarina sp. TaxID=575652 RepID=UPI002615031F|nr:DUF3644 domain-containing protein [uncultured Aquimarina sp.]